MPESSAAALAGDGDAADAAASKRRSCTTGLGRLRITKLREAFPESREVEALAEDATVLALGARVRRHLSRAGRLRPGAWESALDQGGVERGRRARRGEPTVCDSQDRAPTRPNCEPTRFDVSVFQACRDVDRSWRKPRATQEFLNATQNYPLLKGVQSNLYKCFMPLSWRPEWTAGELRPCPSGRNVRRPRGGQLAMHGVSTLPAHFQFQNELQLFPTVHQDDSDSASTSTVPEQERLASITIANLFAPATVDGATQHDGQGLVGGIKTAHRRWNTVGHRSASFMWMTQALCRICADSIRRTQERPRLELGCLHCTPALMCVRLSKLSRLSRGWTDRRGRQTTYCGR